MGLADCFHMCRRRRSGSRRSNCTRSSHSFQYDPILEVRIIAVILCYYYFESWRIKIMFGITSSKIMMYTEYEKKQQATEL
mmetsp:Transcript_29081/g.29527  ORF Transcript_29081/g.29527 Transcript_29081/m.29527 type:complete len:81 (+) Transcript_29081:202-444(+)